MYLNFASAFAAILFLVPISLPAVQQQQPADSEQRSAQQSDLTSQIELTISVYKSMFRKVEIDEGQRAKINEVIENVAPSLVAAQNRFQSVLTAKEHQEFKSHFRLGRVGKFTIDHAENYALERLNLPAERASRYRQAKKELKALESQFRDQLIAVLPEDQLEKLPLFAQNRPKTLAGALVLPNMKDEQDAAVVKAKLQVVKGLEIVAIDLQKNELRYRIKKRRELFKRLKELVAAGETTFDNYSIGITTKDGFEELLMGKPKPAKKPKPSPTPPPKPVDKSGSVGNDQS